MALGTGGCTWRRRPLAWVLWLRDLLARGFIGRGDGDMGPPTPQAWRSNLDLLRDEVDGLAARFVGHPADPCAVVAPHPLTDSFAPSGKTDNDTVPYGSGGAGRWVQATNPYRLPSYKLRDDVLLPSSSQWGASMNRWTAGFQLGNDRLVRDESVALERLAQPRLGLSLCVCVVPSSPLCCEEMAAFDVVCLRSRWSAATARSTCGRTRARQSC